MQPQIFYDYSQNQYPKSNKPSSPFDELPRYRRRDDKNYIPQISQNKKPMNQIFENKKIYNIGTNQLNKIEEERKENSIYPKHYLQKINNPRDHSSDFNRERNGYPNVQKLPELNKADNIYQGKINSPIKNFQKDNQNVKENDLESLKKEIQRLKKVI